MSAHKILVVAFGCAIAGMFVGGTAVVLLTAWLGFLSGVTPDPAMYGLGGFFGAVFGLVAGGAIAETMLKARRS